HALRSAQRGRKRPPSRPRRHRACQGIKLTEIGKPKRVAKPCERPSRQPARIFDEILAAGESMSFDEPVAVDKRTVMEHPYDLGGSEHVDKSARPGESRPQRRGEIIAGANCHRN